MGGTFLEMAETVCAVCSRRIRKGEKRYTYHETDDGNHKLGGFVNFGPNRKDGALDSVCEQCYETNKKKVCQESQILAEVGMFVFCSTCSIFLCS